MPDSDPKIVRWEELKPAAEVMFDVWVDRREMQWAADVWAKLTERRLTHYHSYEERMRVLTRFFALGGIYRDFCRLARDEYAQPTYGVWASEIGLGASDFAATKAPTADDDLSDDDGEEVNHWLDDEEEALIEAAANEARPDVVEALLDAFGGQNELFALMYRTTISDAALTKQWYDEDLEDYIDEPLDEEEILDSILNNMTDEKLDAFAWIGEGCYPIGWGVDYD